MPGSVMDWFVPARAAQEAPVQVFAFPHAGGGCASFAGVAAAAGSRLDVWTVNLPGRQARFLEEPRTALRPLVTELADGLTRIRDDRPYALVGYCAGALFAFALAEELRNRGSAPAARLVTVSFASPRFVVADADLLTASSTDFWAEIVARGGVHPNLAQDADAIEIFEPGLRGDFALLADWRPAGQVIDVPVTALVGEDDELLDDAAVDDWRHWTSAGLTTRRIPGDHWQLEADPAGLAVALVGELVGEPAGEPVGEPAGG